MTGLDFQMKLNGIVSDLQTKGKGQTVLIAFRNASNGTVSLPLSSDPNGIVNAQELANIQGFINSAKPIADLYTSESLPVSDALDAFKMASAPFTALSDAATLARKTLNDAQFADPIYQAAKTALSAARIDPNYVNAKAAYEAYNISENYGNLGDAKGKYSQG